MSAKQAQASAAPSALSVAKLVNAQPKAAATAHHTAALAQLAASTSAVNVQHAGATPKQAAATPDPAFDNVTPGRGSHCAPAPSPALSPYFAGISKPVLGQSRAMTPYECVLFQDRVYADWCSERLSHARLLVMLQHKHSCHGARQHVVLLCRLLRSDSDEEPEPQPGMDKTVPSWSEKNAIWEACLKFEHINPDKVFGECARTVDLEAYFPESDPTYWQNRPPSPGWGRDKLKQSEVEYFNSCRKYKPM